jgi:hypothetical protein
VALSSCSRHHLAPEQTGELIRSEEQLWWPIVRQVEAQEHKPAR